MEKDSNKTYTDRLEEQFKAFAQLANNQFVICGDFNLKLGWPQKKKAYQRLKKFVSNYDYVWPTEIDIKVTIDPSIQYDKGKDKCLSDHPFVLLETESM